MEQLVFLMSYKWSSKVYDVTRGHSFYGPGGAYGNLAGHDATRALAKMDVKAVSDEWDDHAGLDPSEKVFFSWTNNTFFVGDCWWVGVFI